MPQVRADGPLTFHECCAAICASAKANLYAKAYAEAGLDLMAPAAQAVQALYILNNITHWRGEKSREVRAALKEFSA